MVSLRIEPQRSCCTDELVEFASHILSNYTGEFSLSIGNSDEPCCVINGGLAPSRVIPIWSASKLVTGYIILRLIDKGLLAFDTSAAEVLEWWTDDPSDPRSTVTVRQLLAQTDGMGRFNIIGSWDVLGLCAAWDNVGCAKHAYRSFDAPPGEKFTYSETSFYVLGAIAMKVTGHHIYDSVFRELIANPLNMLTPSSAAACVFNKGSLTGDSMVKSDPGGGLSCSVKEYTKFLSKVYAQEIVSAELHIEAERVQTFNASNMPANLSQYMGWPSERSHYALGSWRDCVDQQCADKDGIMIHSIGAQGFVPWIWREGNASHWGILARSDNMTVSALIMHDLLPHVSSAMERFVAGANDTLFREGQHSLVAALVSGACKSWGMLAFAAITATLANLF